MTAGGDRVDCAIIGAGVMGASVALPLARAGMRVVLLDRGPICREASGVNAGTLTMQMTRAALIPYALKAWELWMDAPRWLGLGVGAEQRDGLSVAFTEAEVAILEARAAARRQAGAPITLVDGPRAREIEPGLTDRALRAGHCPVDGFASAYLTGRAFRIALEGAGVTLREGAAVTGVERIRGGHRLSVAGSEPVVATRVVLAGGVWLEEMARWFGFSLPIKVLINQLAVTGRMPPVMRSVLGIASGLLSLKQYPNGTVLIGGGWQGKGGRHDGRGDAFVPAALVGNIRLAAFVLPALRHARIVRAWLGLEAETADALPVLGPLPSVEDGWIIGSVHSGYTSGPFMGALLADAILGRSLALPLFPIDRLLEKKDAA
jgi:glycine/D-amino acid oxidase-like deaminating enzyme